MDLYSYFSCSDFAVCAKLSALSISPWWLRSKQRITAKIGVSYIEVTAGGEVLREVQTELHDLGSRISPAAGKCRSSHLLCISQSCCESAACFKSNFTYQIISVSVSPLPSASPESKLHPHHTWQGTQPTAAHSHHSYLHKVPINYTRAGTSHLPNFTANFLNHLLL